MKNINVAIRVVYFSCANNTDLRCKLISLSSDNHEKILWEKRISISSHKTRKHSKGSALIRVLVVIAMAILWQLSNHAGKYKEALHTNKVAELINVVDINHWCLCRFIDTINTREVLKWSKVVFLLCGVDRANRRGGGAILCMKSILAIRHVEIMAYDSRKCEMDLSR